MPSPAALSHGRAVHGPARPPRHADGAGLPDAEGVVGQVGVDEVDVVRGVDGQVALDAGEERVRLAGAGQVHPSPALVPRHPEPARQARALVGRLALVRGHVETAEGVDFQARLVSRPVLLHADGGVPDGSSGQGRRPRVAAGCRLVAGEAASQQGRQDEDQAGALLHGPRVPCLVISIVAAWRRPVRPVRRWRPPSPRASRWHSRWRPRLPDSEEHHPTR